MRNVIVVFIAMSAIAGAAQDGLVESTRDYRLDKERQLIKYPITVKPCSPQHNTAVLSATWLAMQSLGWGITQGGDDFFRATACRKTFCASVDVFLLPIGQVEIWRTPNQDIDANGRAIMERWMELFAGEYMKHACKDPKALADEYDGTFKVEPTWDQMLEKREKRNRKWKYYPRWFEWRSKAADATTPPAEAGG